MGKVAINTNTRKRIFWDVAELRQEMQVGFARLEAHIERSKSDLLKWSFVFWVGAVGAIAALAGILRG